MFDWYMVSVLCKSCIILISFQCSFGILISFYTCHVAANTTFKLLFFFSAIPYNTDTVWPQYTVGVFLSLKMRVGKSDIGDAFLGVIAINYCQQS